MSLFRKFSLPESMDHPITRFLIRNRSNGSEDIVDTTHEKRAFDSLFIEFFVDRFFSTACLSATFVRHEPNQPEDTIRYIIEYQ